MPQTAPPSRWLLALLALLTAAGTAFFIRNLLIVIEANRTGPAVRPPLRDVVYRPPTELPPPEPEYSITPKVLVGDEPSWRLASLYRPADLQTVIKRIEVEFDVKPDLDDAERAEQMERFANESHGAALLARGLFAAYESDAGADLDAAAAAFEAASAAGYPRGDCELARLYLQGRGVPKDTARAASLLYRARDSDDLEALFLLGCANRLDLLPASDLELGTALLLEACRRGHPSARVVVYWLHKEGRITLSDRSQPERWVIDSVRSGDDLTVRELAFRQFHGGESDDAFGLLDLAITADSAACADARTAILLKSPTETARPATLAAMAQRRMANLASTPSQEVLLCGFIHLLTPRDAIAAETCFSELRSRGDWRGRCATILLSEGVPPGHAYLVLRQTGEAQAAAMEAHLTSMPPRGETDEPPRLLVRTEPKYPRKLRRDGVEGRAVLGFVVDVQGAVCDIAVLECTHPEFGENAKAALEQWYFRPGMKSGRNVATRMKQPFRFALNP